MFNPFTEVSEGGPTDAELFEQAKSGDRAALEKLVLRAATVREIEDVLERQHVDIFRDHPFLQPADQVSWLRRMLEDKDVRGALHLN